jgi:hypothetical protein
MTYTYHVINVLIKMIKDIICCLVIINLLDHIMSRFSLHIDL